MIYILHRRPEDQEFSAASCFLFFRKNYMRHGNWFTSLKLVLLNRTFLPIVNSPTDYQMKNTSQTVSTHSFCIWWDLEDYKIVLISVGLLILVGPKVIKCFRISVLTGFLILAWTIFDACLFGSLLFDKVVFLEMMQ